MTSSTLTAPKDERLASSFEAHAKDVHAMDVADGYMITAGKDTTIKVFDLITKEAVHTLAFHTYDVNAVLVVDGIVYSGADAIGRDRVWMTSWDLKTGVRREDIKFVGHTRPVYALCKGPRGQTILSGGDDFTIRMWNTATGECLKVFRGHTGNVRSIALGPNGTFFSGGHDNSVRQWDSSTGECIRVFEGHAGWVTSVAFDGTSLFSGSVDKCVKKWDIGTGAALFTSNLHDGWVSSLAVGPAESGVVFTGSGDCSIVAWDTATGNPMAQMKGHTYSCSAVKVTEDGSMYSTSWDGCVREWVIFDIPDLARDGSSFASKSKSNVGSESSSGKSSSKAIFEFDESSEEEESDDEEEEGGKNDRPRIVEMDDDESDGKSSTFLTSQQPSRPKIEVLDDDDDDDDLEGLE